MQRISNTAALCPPHPAYPYLARNKDVTDDVVYLVTENGFVRLTDAPSFLGWSALGVFYPWGFRWGNALPIAQDRFIPINDPVTLKNT